MACAEVFKADLILKVAPPTHAEIEMLRHKQILISALQLTVQPKDTLRRMMEKRMTAVAWDFIKDREGIYPIIRAMGEIAGQHQHPDRQRIPERRQGRTGHHARRHQRCGTCRSGHHRCGHRG